MGHDLTQSLVPPMFVKTYLLCARYADPGANSWNWIPRLGGGRMGAERVLGLLKIQNNAITLKILPDLF